MEKINLEGDEKTGLNILQKALEVPLKQIAENSGLDGEVVAAEVRKQEGAFGFNAQKMIYEDLILAGIIDPTKVVRAALENAASAASMLLITQAVVAELPEEEKNKHEHEMPEGY